MSHYVVLVLGENHEEQLEPFDERLEVDEYKVYLTEKEVTSMRDHYQVKTDSTLVEKMEEWNGDKGGKDKKGIYYLTTYNPNSKWDWYQLGGRWSGFLKLKPGAEGVRGSYGVGDSCANKHEGYTDQTELKNIDLEGMRKKAGEEARKVYLKVEKMCGGKIPKVKPWLDLIKNQDTKNIQKLRDEYHNQDGFKLFQKIKEGYDEEVYFDLDDFQCTREEYITRARNNAVTPYAILDHGEWITKGKMGWFGCSEDNLTQAEWAKLVDEKLNNLSPDTLVTVIDCHI